MSNREKQIAELRDWARRPDDNTNTYRTPEMAALINGKGMMAKQALSIVDSQAKEIEDLKAKLEIATDFIEGFDIEPYPETVFRPLENDQFNKVVKFCEESGFVIDRLSAHILRHPYSAWRIDALKILNQINSSNDN